MLGITLVVVAPPMGQALPPIATVTMPRAVPSSGILPVSTYLVSQDLATAKWLLSWPSTAIISSMDPVFLLPVSSLHMRMVCWRRKHDCHTSVTPMASDVSCSETANSDKLGMSWFSLCITRNGIGIKMSKSEKKKKKKGGEGGGEWRGGGREWKGPGFYSEPERQRAGRRGSSHARGFVHVRQRRGGHS